jgi:hypothetical protein
MHRCRHGRTSVSRISVRQTTHSCKTAQIYLKTTTDSTRGRRVVIKAFLSVRGGQRKGLPSGRQIPAEIFVTSTLNLESSWYQSVTTACQQSCQGLAKQDFRNQQEVLLQTPLHDCLNLKVHFMSPDTGRQRIHQSLLKQCKRF